MFVRPFNKSIFIEKLQLINQKVEQIKWLLDR
jgi:hypothetical protein